MLEKLKKELYIEKIICPTKKDLIIVEELNKILNNIQEENIKLLIKAIIKFLSTPIVIDKFKDHNQRRKFIKSLNPRQVDFFLNNRLRVNIFTPILEIIETFDLFIEDKVFRKEFDKLFKSAKNYNNFTIEEKLNFINKLKNFCYLIYEKIKMISLIN